MLIEARDRLLRYMEQNNFHGYDPYDWLASPFLKPLPHRLQFLAQQVGRRLPLNLRPALAVQPGYNPVTLGLSIQAYTYMATTEPDKKDALEKRVRHLADELERLRSTGYDALCWGYDFHWAARYTSIPAGSPNIVATGVIIHALFEAYQVFQLEKLKNMVCRSVSFVTENLNCTESDEGVCYSYSPNDHQLVLNASMKAVRLLAQVYFLTQKETYKKRAEAGAAFVIHHQNPDGSWPYALNDARTWVDNYHTGYILDCLDIYSALCQDDQARPALEKGLDYYSNTFFYQGRIPKFRSDRIYPVDSTGVAQSILTLSRFEKLDTAWSVADFALQKMRHKNGAFYFRLYRYYSNRIIYMRWSNAWMVAALSYLILKTGKNNDA